MDVTAWDAATYADDPLYADETTYRHDAQACSATIWIFEKYR